MTHARTGKTWCIVDLPQCDRLGAHASGLFFAIAKSVRHPKDHSILASMVNMERNENGLPACTLVSVHDVIAPAFAVENVFSKIADCETGDESRVWVVRPWSDWTTVF